ncbi:MAG: SAVED domain-containing protein [Chloroflexota bacterium]|nr:SAVED domain-containing protein [Chloroflexota bacterium]
MDILQLAKDALEAIQQMQPGIESAAKVTTALTTIGSTGVKLLERGKNLYTYLVGRLKDGEAEKQKPTTVEPKEDVAILVDINRRLLQDVAQYLHTQGIDANLIIVTNDPAYSSQVRFLSVEDSEEWETLVQDFNQAINVIKHTVGSARLHFFLSTPLPIAFGLGSVWGTVDEATVYHWERGTYHPVMNISRQLRQ